MAVDIRTFCAAAAFAALLASGCASDEAAKDSERSPESSGFAWVGEGEPTNFATDHNFCSRTAGVSGINAGRFSTGADAGVNPYTSGRPNSARGDYAAKRQFWQCMESRGWQLVGAR